MFEKFRKPGFAVAVAFGLSILATVDTSFAQNAMSREVTIPDLPALPGQTAIDPTSLEPGLLDLGNVPSVNAHVMALVSLQAKQVELAKTPLGAKSVAADLIAVNYSKWNSSQISCLDQLWNNESHWNFKAHHPQAAHKLAGAFFLCSAMLPCSNSWFKPVFLDCTAHFVSLHVPLRHVPNDPSKTEIT